jgi:hypothetical protein
MIKQNADRLLSVVNGLSEERIAEAIDFANYLKLKDMLRERDVQNFDVWAERIAKRKGLDNLTEDEAASIVMECRNEALVQT